MKTNSLPTTVARPHPGLANRRTSPAALYTVCAVAIAGGVLSSVGAKPKASHAMPDFRKPMVSTAHPRGRRPNTSFKTMEQSDILASKRWLNLTDHQELRTYARIFGEQVPDDSAMFPDVQSILVREPGLQGLAVVHDDLRSPWNGNKGPDEYSRDSEERLLKSRDNWAQYVASYRTIADRLGADNAIYPTAPHVLREAKLEFGSEHERSPGQYAYAPDLPGNVSVRDRTLGREAVYVQCVMQRPQIASWAADKMATAFLSPVYGGHHVSSDLKFEAASRKGNAAAAQDESQIASCNSSRLRGAYARRAARVYHNTYLKAYHESL